MNIFKRIQLPYWLLAPTILFVIIFFLFPLAQVITLAFRTDQAVFTLAHFEYMMEDLYFGNAVKNTLLLTAVIIPTQLILAFIAALIVNKSFKGSTFFLYIYAIPLGISELAAGLIWLSIFTERGFLNSIMHYFGVLERPLVYLSNRSPEWLVTAIVLTEVWRATPLVMVILLSGLQMIAKDYLEAGEMFGCTPWQKVRLIILPLLKPSIQSALIIRTMLAFQVFGPIIVLAGRLFPVLAGESYFWASLFRNDNIAAAYAMLLMLLSVVITWCYIYFLRTKDEQVGVM